MRPISGVGLRSPRTIRVFGFAHAAHGRCSGGSAPFGLRPIPPRSIFEKMKLGDEDAGGVAQHHGAEPDFAFGKVKGQVERGGIAGQA